MKLFNESYVNPRIQKQINMYIEDYHFSYSGILKTLVYFYEVKKNSIDKSHGGIGIVPYVYKDAFNYYYSLWSAHEKNKDKNFSSCKLKTKVIKIRPPERKPHKRKVFTFLDEFLDEKSDSNE